MGAMSTPDGFVLRVGVGAVPNQLFLGHLAFLERPVKARDLNGRP